MSESLKVCRLRVRRVLSNDRRIIQTIVRSIESFRAELGCSAYLIFARTNLTKVPGTVIGQKEGEMMGAGGE